MTLSGLLLDSYWNLVTVGFSYSQTTIAITWILSRDVLYIHRPVLCLKGICVSIRVLKCHLFAFVFYHLSFCSLFFQDHEEASAITLTEALWPLRLH